MAFTLVKASNIDTAANLSFTSASLTTSLSIGSAVASAGELRLKVGQSIKYRNSVNTVDLNLLSIDAGNVLTFGGNDQGHIYHNVATGQNHYKQVNGSTITTTNSTGLTVNGVITSTGVTNKLGTGDTADVTLQIGADSPAVNRSTRISFLSATSGAGARNWFINTNWNTAGCLDFAPSTTNGGTTMGSTVLSISSGGVAVTGFATSTSYVRAVNSGGAGTGVSQQINGATTRLSSCGEASSVPFTIAANQTMYLRPNGYWIEGIISESSNGNGCKFYCSYASSTVNIQGDTSIFVNSSSPTASQLGIYKSANDGKVYLKAGSSWTRTMYICVLGDSIYDYSNPA